MGRSAVSTLMMMQDKTMDACRFDSCKHNLQMSAICAGSRLHRKSAAASIACTLHDAHQTSYVTGAAPRAAH